MWVKLSYMDPMEKGKNIIYQSIDFQGLKIAVSFREGSFPQRSSRGHYQLYQWLFLVPLTGGR